MAAPVREHLLSRGKWAQRANDFLTRAWAKGWLPEPDLSPDALWEIARKPYSNQAKVAENGGRGSEDAADFRERFERLCASIESEAALNTLGRTMAYGQLMRALRNRLALGALWAEQPQLLQARLAPPIIVIGQMRSGTTRIQKLFAADPAHSHTRYCDSFHPLPSRDWAKRARGRFDIAMLSFLNPWLQSIHPMASSEVEEELGWLGGALHHSIYEAQWNVPGFAKWSEERDPAPVYREFSRILRTDAAHRANANRPRVMKVPAFSEDLPTLLAQFPDARLVVAQRDREAVLASAISLAANQMAVQSDSCDLARITDYWKAKIALREQRLEAFLATWNGPVTRQPFDALNQDWEGEIRRAYKELNLQLSPAALAEMTNEIARSQRGTHRAHSQQLTNFS